MLRLIKLLELMKELQCCNTPIPDVPNCLCCKQWRCVLSTGLSVVSALVFQRCVGWRHTKKSGGFAWLGRAAAAMYQYSKRTLSKTTSSPMGPSTHHSLFMDAEHASCHLVSPLSLLPSASCTPFACVQTQMPATVLSWHVSNGCSEGWKCFEGDDSSL